MRLTSADDRVNGTMVPVTGSNADQASPAKASLGGFRYHEIEPALAKEMREVASDVRDIPRKSVIDAGLKLQTIKDRGVEQGQFRAWVKQECGFDIRTAQRWMKAAKLISEHDKLSYLPVDGLLALASRKAVPVLDAILARIENGEKPSTAQIKRQISPKNDSSKDLLERLKAEVAKLDKGNSQLFREWFHQFDDKRRQAPGETIVEPPTQTVQWSSDALAPEFQCPPGPAPMITTAAEAEHA